MLTISRTDQIPAAVEMLLNHQHLTIQDADVVATALENFRKRPTVSFTDNLIVEIARKSGHIRVGTFDRDLAKLEGTERLQMSDHAGSPWAKARLVSDVRRARNLPKAFENCQKPRCLEGTNLGTRKLMCQEIARWIRLTITLES